VSAGACPAQGETILIAEGSLDVVLAAKAVSDIGGIIRGRIYCA
jgi:hypothetical protein